MNRLGFQLQREQENINNIVDEAYKQLEGETVTNEPVDDDWIARFFVYTKNISNKEIQIIWSKILSGEIRKPGSFSFLTLNVLQNIDYQNAQHFLQIAKYVVGTINNYVVPSKILNQNQKQFVDFGMVNELDSLGLISQDPNTSIVFYMQNKPVDLFLFNNKKVIFLQAANIKKDFHINGYILSRAGRELLSLVDVECDPYFIQQCVKYLYSIDKDFNIWVGDLISLEKDVVKLKNQYHMSNDI